MKILKCCRNKVKLFWSWIGQIFMFVLKGIIQFVKLIKSRINTTLFVTLIITLVTTVLGSLAVNIINKKDNYHKFKSKPFLTFESDNVQVFHLSKEVKNLEYSVGEDEWRELKDQTIVFGGSCGKLLLRGICDTGTNGSTILFGTDAEVVCTGDIYTLVNYVDYDKIYKKDTTLTTTSNAKFDHLFENCKQLVVAPEMSSTKLACNCYESMYSCCTSLLRAPELPAGILSKGCYKSMFEGCTALKVAPEIKAKEVAEESCLGMFKGCTALEKAPELPASQLARKCYSNMFESCSILQTAPTKLPADILADACYVQMFENCISLINPPDLPAKELSQNCYSNMFKNCKSLINAPVLPATSLADGCYTNMFFGCTALKQITMLATTINKNQCSQWLEKASSKGVVFINKKATWVDKLEKDILPSGWETVLYE